jgi:tetratricopeptide (TPR) repeat protein
MVRPYFRRTAENVRRLAVVAIVIVLGIFALIQLGSDAIFGESAAAGALPRAIPRSAGVTIYDAAARLPRPAFFRRVAAQAAIEDGRLARAQRLVTSMPDGADRDDLQGRIFSARGDHARAVARYVAAGDLARVGDAVDAFEREGNLALALVTQRRLLGELLAADDQDDLAHAYWRLAQLEGAAGLDAAALADYQHAIRLEPLSETYLLGAANQSMGHRGLALARAYFARVVQLDPGSADGHVGIGRVAVRTGDLAEARRQAAIVSRLVPGYPGLVTLEREIASPSSRP